MTAPYYTDAGCTLYRANALNLPLEDESVDLVVTSPPYFGLRSYTDGGEHYDGQIGDEATPAEFVDALIAATREMVRVLKPSGSIWVNLGDKYAQDTERTRHGVGSRQTSTDGGLVRGAYLGGMVTTGAKTNGVPRKSLIGVPWRYALRCIDELGLILRAEVIWEKGNGLPESVRDRVRRSHETWFHFVKSPRYYSSVDTIREPLSVSDSSRPRSAPVVLRPTVHAPSRRPALGPELPATVNTDEGPTDSSGWCDFGQSKVSVDFPVADVAHRLQVVELVGFQVGVETPEGDLVVDLQVVDPRASVRLAADGTAMPVAVQRSLALLDPVGAAIAVSTPAPRGAVLASQGGAPCSVALSGAKATGLEVALVSGDGFAARIALASEEGGSALYVWDSLAAHRASLPPSSEPLGKLPGSVWHVNTQPLRVPPELGVDHFAAFPMEWPRRIIRGWSPPGVCVECGDGRRPVSEKAALSSQGTTLRAPRGTAAMRGPIERVSGVHQRDVLTTITGYACSCPEPTAPTRPAVVLDPFGGTGTTALVAKALGRHGISVDLSADYCRLAKWRVTDPGELARALEVEKPPTVMDDQGDLLEGLLA